MFLLETLVALAVIAAAAYLAVRLSQRRLRVAGARMRVVERLPLAHRRMLHLVEVDGRSFLIGTSERAIRLLAPLDGGRTEATSVSDGESAP